MLSLKKIFSFLLLIPFYWGVCLYTNFIAVSFWNQSKLFLFLILHFFSHWGGVFGEFPLIGILIAKVHGYFVKDFPGIFIKVFGILFILCASRNFLWLVMLFVFLFVPNDELLFLPTKMDLKWCQMRPLRNDISQFWLVMVFGWYLWTITILEQLCLQVVTWLGGIHSQYDQSNLFCSESLSNSH